MYHLNNYKVWALVLLTVGLLTDIFDGIIARRLGVSTPFLRRLDSTVDQVFFITVAVATYIQCPLFFKTNSTQIIVLLGLEALAYLICYLKFNKEIATHSIGAKIWTVLMFAMLVQVIWQCQSIVLFQLWFWVGILTRIEIVAIILLLKVWTNDVPTVYHARLLSKGKPIKRHKFFNG